MPDPIDRAALFIADSRMPSRLPPRGPVEPKIMSEIALPEPVCAGAVVFGAPLGVGAVSLASAFACRSSVRALSFS